MPIAPLSDTLPVYVRVKHRRDSEAPAISSHNNGKRTPGTDQPAKERSKTAACVRDATQDASAWWCG